MAERPTKPFEWLYFPHLFFNYLFLRGWQLIVLFIDPVYPGHLAWQAAAALPAFFMFPAILTCPIPTSNGLLCSSHIHLQPQFPLNKGWLSQEGAGCTVFFLLVPLLWTQSYIFSCKSHYLYLCPECCARAPFWSKWVTDSMLHETSRKHRVKSFPRKITLILFINHLVISI